ncbi:MAG: trypsin-like peptidase domain-containing protein [Rubrivivax sp.]|nr:trypsin-like peptidase domain-containing protein [Pyrinomonadaceae bacterium]
MFSYFPDERITEIKKFFYEDPGTGYDRGVRRLLTKGINPRWVGRLRNFDDDASQLSGDLHSLNSTERLADGSVPFEVWLRNAADEYGHEVQGKVFPRLLDELTTRATGAPPIEDPARMPEVREAVVHQNDMVAYGFLSAGQKAGESVARLSVTRYDNLTPAKLPGGETAVYHGTGWLLAPELLITNHHVVNARNDGEGNASLEDLKLQARNTVVQFDYNGKTMAGTPLSGSPELLAFDVPLDYAVLRLPARVEGRAPLSPSDSRVEVTKETYLSVNIIQHPLGGPKMVALRNNLVYDGNYPKLRYFTDTEHGSSGSPVFSDEWRVVALHRASNFVEGVRFQGRLAGWVNEGTQMAAILEHLRANHAEVYSAIGGGAPAPQS